MRTYQVKIFADKWPTEYIVVASNWATAIARAVKEWKLKFKGSRTSTIKIIATKGGQLLQENGKIK